MSGSLGSERDESYFHIIEQIGRGTYGMVYVAHCGESKDLVAIKKMHLSTEADGFPLSALREIKILSNYPHENIIQLKEIATCRTSPQSDKEDVYLVFEYADADLTGLLELCNEGGFPCYSHQILRAIDHLHRHRVVHRDLKPSNILITRGNVIKLADFGLSRLLSKKEREYTSNVITLWFRPPELILGERKYGFEVDMWSYGCILANLLTYHPIFSQSDEFSMMQSIVSVCGPPDDSCRGYYEGLPTHHLLHGLQGSPSLRRMISHSIWEHCGPAGEWGPPSSPSARVCEEALDLIEKLLVLDPKKRLTASEVALSSFSSPSPTWQALQHPWFRSVVPPQYLPPLPLSETGKHEYQSKKRKREM